MTFLNYFRDASRESPINIAVGRALLGSYLLWKVLSYEWVAMAEWPTRLRSLYMFLHPAPLRGLVVVEKWLLVGLLIAFVLGYRLGIVSVLSAILVTHMASLMWSLTASGQTTSFFIAVYLLIFFGLYREHDELSVDALRRTRNRSIAALNAHLKSDGTETYRLDALKWGLVALGVIYFGSGLDKAIRTPLSTWVQTENLARILIYRDELYHTSKPVAEFMLSHPILIQGSAWGTIVLELGFLPAILAGVTITPFIVAFAGMHAVIALAVGPFFFDLYIFYLLFVPWDRIHERLAADEPIDLVYDERCFFCARSLYPFKVLDVKGTVSFYSQSDVPERYRSRDDVDFESEMYVFKGGRAYPGYLAFRELLRQFGVFAPLVRLMERPSIEQVGTRIYRYVARNRNRHFTCAVDLDADANEREEAGSGSSPGESNL